MTTRIGYVGLDHHHRDPYLQSIEQLDANVTAVCDPDSAITLQEIPALPNDIPYYHDPTVMLDDAPIDAIWVTLSNRRTPHVIESALERDIGVVTEKPVARTAADLEPLLAAEREADATVAVSYTWRAHPFAERLRGLVAEGFFGDVRAFDTRFVASSLATRNPDHYLYDEAESRGGIVQWLGVHWLELLPWILDDPITRVHAHTRKGTPGVNVEDGAMVQLETESGTDGTLTCGYYLGEGRYDTDISIYGRSGRSSWDPIGSTFGFDGETILELDDASPDSDGTHRREITHEYDATPGYGGGWGLTFLDESLTAATTNTDPPAGLHDARTVLHVLDAVYQSAESGEWAPVARR